jgi:hypothetical protein
MKIEIVQGKWNCSDAFLDLFINSKRELEVEVKHTKIGKKYNYHFEFKNKDVKDIEVNDYQLVTP